MALNIPIPFQLATPKRPNFLADQKALAELPFHARAKESEVMGKELENVFNRIRNETAGEKNRTDIAHTRAQTGLTNVQTKRGQARLPYEEPFVRAEIAQMEADAYKKQQPETGELAKAVNDYNTIRAREGADSPLTGIAGDYLQRKAQGAPGTEMGIDANGNAYIKTGGMAGAGTGKGGAGNAGRDVDHPFGA